MRKIFIFFSFIYSLICRSMDSYIYFILWAILKYCYISFAQIVPALMVFFKFCIFRMSHLSKELFHISLESPKMLGVGLRLMTSEDPGMRSCCHQLQIFFPVCSVHQCQSHHFSSRSLVIISEPGCRVLMASSEKQKCSESCKRPRPWCFRASALSLEMLGGMGGINSHEVPSIVPLTSLISVAIGGLGQVMNLVQSEVSWEGNENRGLTGRLVDFLPLGNKCLLWSSLISFPHASCHLLYLGWVLRAPLGSVQTAVLRRLIFFFNALLLTHFLFSKCMHIEGWSRGKLRWLGNMVQLKPTWWGNCLRVQIYDFRIERPL